ncbi:MAG TPA: IclR family transcriptional regulator [Candidatus Mediterraneibacter merdavium]|nr:IclR family transcriptional regulator [Candidatus Mediterraneibacter merdavium]
MEQKNPIQVAGRLFQTLELLADTGSIGLMELSDTLGLNKTTAHRVLNSLIYMGYARQNPANGKYEPTFKIVDIATRIMSKVDILQSVRPYLRRLMEASGETVHFVERDGTDAVYIDKVEAFNNGMQMVSRIGSRIPLYCSGVGKAMMARMEDWEAEEIWNTSDICALTEHTITDHEEFKKELEQIRQQGYALDNEENQIGVRCIACSLKVPMGDTKYAFSISAPVSRMDDGRIRELADYVLGTAKEMAENLAR